MATTSPDVPNEDEDIEKSNEVAEPPDLRKSTVQLEDATKESKLDSKNGSEDAGAQKDPAESIEGDSDTSSWDSEPLQTSIKRYHPLPHGEKLEDDQQNTKSVLTSIKPPGIKRLQDQVSFNASTDLDEGGQTPADSDYEACESSDETIDATVNLNDEPDDHSVQISKPDEELDDEPFNDAIEEDVDSDEHLSLPPEDSNRHLISSHTRGSVGSQTNKDKFEHLLKVLQEQHQQQVALQKEQQENQLKFISMQISELVMPDDKQASNYQQRAAAETSHFPEEFLQHSPDKATTDEDVDKDVFTGSLKVSGLSETTESLAAIQHHFLEQQQKLQQEYDRYLEDLQRQWMMLHEKQIQQKQLLSGTTAEQMKGIRKQNHTQKHNRSLKMHETPVKEDDDNSTVYSNFSYWKYDDTYRPLPKTHTRQDYTAFLDDPADLTKSSSVTPDSQVSDRLDLKQKHSRHIADLKDFYENEILELKQQLHDSVSQNGVPPQSIWKEANERLHQKCHQLEAALRLSSNRIEDLEATVRTLDTRLIEWPKKYEVAIDTITVLEKQAENLTILCAEKDSELSDCKNRVEELKLYITQLDQFNKSANEFHETMSEVNDLKRSMNKIYGDVEKLQHGLNKEKDEVEQSVDTKFPKHSGIQDDDNYQSRRLQGQNIDSFKDKSAALEALPQQLQYVKPHVPSVEERKFLTSGADFNLFNGEIKHSSDTEKDSDNMQSDSESGIYHLPDSDLDASLNQSGLFASMRSTLHPPPFDSDLDERPISPMMKAAAQFHRWKQHEELERSQSNLHHQLGKESKPLMQSSPHEPQQENDSPLSIHWLQSKTSMVGTEEKRRYHQYSVDAATQSSETVALRNLSDNNENKFYESHSEKKPKLSGNSSPSSSHSRPVSAGNKRSPKHSEKSSPLFLSRLESSGNKKSPRQSENFSPSQSRPMSTGNKKTPKRSNNSNSPARRLFDQDFKQTQTSHLKVKEKSFSSLGNTLTSPYSPPRTQRSVKSYQAKSLSPNSPNLRKSLLSNSPMVKGSPASRKTLNSKSDVLAETPTKDVGSMPRKKWNTDANCVLQTLDHLKSSSLTNTEFLESKKTSNRNHRNSNNSNFSVIRSSSMDDKMSSLSAVEKQYDHLTKEKTEIEAALSRLPPSSRMSRQSRKDEEQLESRYDEVVRELGSVRMLLRKYNILKTST